MKMKHEFVKFIPEKKENGVLYISLEYNTATHLCGCGCGYKVITPLSPVDWQLTYDGESVSLYPSIGNWDYPCKSHYWITKGKVKWARKWSDDEIENGRRYDEALSDQYFNKNEKPSNAERKPEKKKRNWLFRLLFGK